jgi:prefoldin subunit 5
MSTKETKARMYGSKSEDATSPKEKRTRVYVNTLAQSFHTIKQSDNVEVHVPSLAYVKNLEQSVKTLMARIEKLEKQITALTGNTIRQKQHINRHIRQIGDINSDLDNKIDRREF